MFKVSRLNQLFINSIIPAFMHQSIPAFTLSRIQTVLNCAAILHFFSDIQNHFFCLLISLE